MRDYDESGNHINRTKGWKKD